MSLQTMKEVHIDFSTEKYISVNAKQYDRASRYILVSCYNQGAFMPINNNTCYAYVRCEKPDNYDVFNMCEITKDGKIVIELTEQILAVAGTAYVDLAICQASEINVDVNDGESNLITVDKGSILSTMTFIINIEESLINDDSIESSYEYRALNDLLVDVQNRYKEVINACNNEKALAERAKEEAELVNNQINGGLIPNGTIPFEELSTVTKEVGYMYNISTDFITTDEFREGAGNEYEAGTNIYYTKDGKWDILVGSIPIAATITEVESWLEIELEEI